MEQQRHLEIALPWRKLAYVAFASLVALLVLGGGYSLLIFEGISAQAENENLAANQALAELGVHFLQNHQKKLFNSLKVISAQNNLKQMFSQKKNDKFAILMQSMLTLSPEVEMLFLANSDGLLLITEPPLSNFLESRSSLPSVAICNSTHYDNLYISPIHTSLLSPHQQVTTLSIPIRDINNQLIGFLGLTQQASYWSNIFSLFSTRLGRSFQLFDQKGVLIASDHETEEAAQGALLELSLLMRQAQMSQGSTATSLGQLPGTPHQAFISAASVTDIGWILVISQDYATAMNPTRAILKNTAFFMVLLFTCLILQGYLLLSRYRIQQHLLTRRDEEARLLEDTVHKRTADLIRSNERYKSLVADLPDMVYEMDASGKLTFVSQAVEAILGYKPNEMIGNFRRIYVLPEDCHLFDEEQINWTKSKNISILVVRHLAKNGRERQLSVHSRGIFDEQGNMIGRRGVARDVTQQVIAERRIRELSHRLINAQEEERKRVALDLHDEMGQLLSALKIGLQSFAEKKGLDDIGELAKLINLSQKIIDRIRTLAYYLRPAILDSFGLVAAIKDLCDSFPESGLIQVECNLTELNEKTLSQEAKIALFRFVQEALTNVVKHADSSRVIVNLSCTAGMLNMSVRDFGKGFNVEQALSGLGGDKHLGLLGMTERISLVGGVLEITSSLNQGSLLIARLPLINHKS